MIPQTEQALLEKAQSIAGLTFGELADELNILEIGRAHV